MPGLQGNRVPGSQAARAAGPQNLSGAVRQVRRQGLGSGRQLKRPNQPCWRSGSSLERFQAKWTPVRVKKTRQIKNLEPRFDSIETEKALGSREGEPAERHDERREDRGLRRRAGRRKSRRRR